MVLIFLTEHLECHSQDLGSADAFEGADNGRAGPCPPFIPISAAVWLWEEVGALLATHGPDGPRRIWLCVVPGRSMSDNTGSLSKASHQLLCQDL